MTRDGRHLAAIMFMDMVGYSARMQENEPRAIAAVRALWELVRPILAQHGGREVDLAGDGMLMEFPGALAAVRCTLQVHAALHDRNAALPEADRIRVRAGVHLGDVEHKDGRIYGDGVNIAARVIALAPPGAVAMSPHVRDQLLNVLDRPIESLGVRTLKNIKQPIELWCVAGPDCRPADISAAKRASDGVDASRKWSFGAAVLDERTLELSVNGEVVTLERKPLEVLLFLLNHAGEVVTKDELFAAVWPGRILSDSALSSCIAKVREALGDANQEVVRTQHGYGYRFVASVTVEAQQAPAAPRFDFKPGTRPPLRPMWSLVERLGTGGHGEAWLGRHDKTRECRVFKFANDSGTLASLKREITLYRLLHDALGDRPEFVRLLDWNLEEPPYFIESEYAEAGSLPQWAEKSGGLGTVPLAARLDIAAQIADALAAAHSVGVLHKDLKPSNILLVRRSLGSGEIPALGPDRGDSPPFRIKLCDFGSGGVLDPRRLAAMGITRMGFTRTGLDASDPTSGTPLYLAPEVLAGQPWTLQADIYALGLILFQLTVGDLHRTLAPGWENDIPDEFLREDIALAAAGNPRQRLADASLLAQRLRTLDGRRKQREAEKIARVKAERQQLAIKRFRVRFWWAVAVTLTLGSAVIGGFFLWLGAYQTAGRATAEVANAARTLWDRGDLPAAERLYRTMLVTSAAWGVYGIRDAFLSGRNGLAQVLMEENKLAEAGDEFTRLLSDTASHFGIEDPHYAMFSSNYGEYLIRVGKYQQARTVLETAQPILDKARAEGLGYARFSARKNTERLRHVYGALGLKAEEGKLPPKPPACTREPRSAWCS